MDIKFKEFLIADFFNFPTMGKAVFKILDKLEEIQKDFPKPATTWNEDGFLMFWDYKPNYFEIQIFNEGGFCYFGHTLDEETNIELPRNEMSEIFIEWFNKIISGKK